MKLLLVLSVFVFTACATDHDVRRMALRKEYRDRCDVWEETKGAKLFERKPGEEFIALQDIMAIRCKEDQENCTPPKKSAELVNLEYMWNSPVTPESCN